VKGALVPAGWIAGADFLRRVAEIVHEVRTAAGLSQAEPFEVARGAAAIAGSALCMPRPSLAAFVIVDDRWFQVPASAWLSVIDQIETQPDALLRAIADDLLPVEFGPYGGLRPLFNAEHAAVWTEGFRTSVLGQTKSPSRDPDRPWRDYTSVSAWLSSSQATAFADALLAARGVLAPRPIDRNIALHSYLAEQGEAFEFESVQSRRRPSMMRG